jgi:hypothetical protein
MKSLKPAATNSTPTGSSAINVSLWVRRHPENGDQLACEIHAKRST